MLTGLVLYGIGALLFIPGGRIQSFEFFLLALFVIGCGLTCLETASNPYVTVLGEPEGSERRINLAQSFNGLGWICGPLAGGFFLFAGGGDVTTPYAVLGTVVLCIAILFSRVKLPEIGREVESGQAEASGKRYGERPRSQWDCCRFSFTWLHRRASTVFSSTMPPKMRVFRHRRLRYGCRSAAWDCSWADAWAEAG